MKVRMIAKALAATLLVAGAASPAAFAHGQGMGPGTMGQGMGYGMGHGMMGYGTGQGMGPGMMGQGMGYGMGPGMMGQGMGYGMGPGYAQGYRDRDLDTGEVKAIMEHRLEHYGNDRLRVGKVEQRDGDVIVVDVETVDGSLVERYLVDRHTGRMQRAN